MRRYVLLDRDGTLVRDVGYPHRLEDYALLPGVVEGLRALRAAGYALAIVTNQSGIGRGLFDRAAYDRFHGRLLADLAAAGIAIDATFLCPHAPEAGCTCRKPAPGLLWQARDALGVALERAWLVGDGARDVEAARRAACRGAVRVGARAARVVPGDRYGFEARDLVEAAGLICAEDADPDQGAP